MEHARHSRHYFRSLAVAWSLGALRSPQLLRNRSLATSLSCSFSSSILPLDDRSRLVAQADRPGGHKAPAVTRFAPSPTGRLHLGSLRTALYNYLIAHATGGRFILRVEDTDRRRTVPGAEENIYSTLKWAGLSWHEGPDVGGPYGPYRQSERVTIYLEWVRKLIASDMAYKCYCDLPEATSFVRDGPVSSTPGCIGACSSISDDAAPPGRLFSVRFRWDGAWQQVAAARGDIRTLTHGGPGQDFVLVKRDGFPTYHFANVVDDHLMGVTHVIRGMEWSVSTRKHLALYHALGWNAPKFSHLGLLTRPDGSKLSKREQSTTIDTYRDLGILPSAMCAWLAEHGGRINPVAGGESVGTMVGLDDLVRRFHHEDFTTGPIQPNFAALEGFQLAHATAAVESGDSAPLMAHVVPALLSRVLAIDLLRRGHPSADPESAIVQFPGASGNAAESAGADRLRASQLGGLVAGLARVAQAESPLSLADDDRLGQARGYALDMVRAEPRHGTDVAVQLPWLFWRPSREQYAAAFAAMPASGDDGGGKGSDKLGAKARVLRPQCAVFLTLLRQRLQDRMAAGPWEAEGLDRVLRDVQSDIRDGRAAGLEAWSAERLALTLADERRRWPGLGVLHMGIRFALHGAWDRAGMGSTPSLRLLGRDEVLARLDTVVGVIAGHVDGRGIKPGE